MNQDDIDKMNYRNLFDHRNFLDKTKVNIAFSFNKYMLTLASGSLYLSILFTQSINKTLIYKEYLIWGWIFLIVSILMIISSIYFSIKAHEKAIDYDDEQIEDLNQNRQSKPSCDCISDFVHCLEKVGILCFIIGIVLLVVFYFNNL